MNFYITENDKPKKLSPGAFYAQLAGGVKALKTDFNPDSIPAVVQLVLKKEEIIVEGEAEKAVELIRKAVEASVEMELGLEREKAQKKQEKASASEAKVKEVQVALDNSENFALSFRKDTELSISSRIAEVVGENFDLTKNGGLVLKKGVTLAAEDAFTAIKGMLTLSDAGATMKSKSALALAGVLGAVNKTLGEEIYSQLLVPENKAIIAAANMIEDHFPTAEREKLDPEGNLQFSHWQELAGRKGFTPKQREKLAKFVAKNPSSRDSIRSLAKSLSLLKDEDKDDVLAAVCKTTSAEAATELIAKYNVNTGNPTNEKISHLYISLVNGAVVIVTSNDWNEDLANNSETVVLLGAKPKFTKDNLTITEVPFIHTAPDTVPLPEKKVYDVVESVEIEEEQLTTGQLPHTRKPKKDKPYAKISVIEKDGAIWVEGTVGGEDQDFEIEGAITVEQGVKMIKDTFGLDADSKDADGRFWEIS